MELKYKAKQLPEKPGVYIMKDNEGNLIYVGKAKSLKNRVSQYFQKSKVHSPKIIKMIEAIRSFEYIITDTELEALLLECRLIKQIKPEYNRQLKNDSRYVYIRLTTKEGYAFLQEIEERQEDGNTYFGPYTSPRNVERAVGIIKQAFKIRHCKAFSKTISGCLNYQLGVCSGACFGAITEAEYLKHIEAVINLILGRDISFLKELEVKMNKAAEKLDFLTAAKYRDDIFALKHITNKQKTIEFTEKNRKIVAMEYMDDTCLKVFLIQGGDIIFSSKINISAIDTEQLKKQVVLWISEYFKAASKDKAKEINKQSIDKAQILYSYLRNKKACNYVIIKKAWLDKKHDKVLDKEIAKLC